MENNNDFNSPKREEQFNIENADEVYKSHNFKRKKRGIAGFFQKIFSPIGNWWSGLKKWKKIVISIVAVFLTLVISLVTTFFILFDYNYKDITTNPEELGFENIIDEKIVNIALFGIDTRNTKSFSGNSDSIMILSINTETKVIKIVSIMRDSLVKIENNGRTYYHKINSAYNSGGPELAIKTLNQNFGLDIREYATVNFYGMAEIIDAVGGIDIELTEQEVNTNHTDGFNGLVKRLCKTLKLDPEKYYIKTSGKHHVNGVQAVAYSRIRKFVNIWGTNNDFGRTDRQRYVMEQLFEKAIKMPKSKYVGLVRSLIPYTETSLYYDEIMGLAFDVLLESPTFEQTRMPLSEYQMKAPYIPRVGSTVYYDLEFAQKLLYEYFYNDVTPEEYVEKNGIGKNDWYSKISGGGGISNNSKPQSTNSSSTDSSTVKPPSTSSSIISSSSEQISSGSQVESSSDVSSTESESSNTSSTSSNTETSSENSSGEATSSSDTTTTPEVSSSENTTTQ